MVTVKAIIVDDESSLIEHLADKLAEFWPELEIVGTAQDGRSGIALALETQADIAFLDIHMPGVSGLQAAHAFPVDTRVVFVTAHEEFALDAFQHEAVDYLLKPLSDARLQQTIQRLQNPPSQVSNVNPDNMIGNNLEEGTYLHWLRAGYGNTIHLVAVQDVIYFKADSKYTEIVTKDCKFEIRLSIKKLEEQLDPELFWRINRGLIVQVKQVLSGTRDERGRYSLVLREHSQVLQTSEKYGYLFKLM